MHVRVGIHSGRSGREYLRLSVPPREEQRSRVEAPQEFRCALRREDKKRKPLICRILRPGILRRVGIPGWGSIPGRRHSRIPVYCLIRSVAPQYSPDIVPGFLERNLFYELVLLEPVEIHFPVCRPVRSGIVTRERELDVPVKLVEDLLQIEYAHLYVYPRDSQHLCGKSAYAYLIGYRSRSRRDKLHKADRVRGGNYIFLEPALFSYDGVDEQLVDAVFFRI